MSAKIPDELKDTVTLGALDQALISSASFLIPLPIWRALIQSGRSLLVPHAVL